MDAIFEFFHKLLHLPVLASESGAGVDRLIIYIHMLMIVLFVGWFGYFVFTIWRFRASRHPKANHQGVRSHASSYLEMGVAVVEVLILVGVAIPLWNKAVDVTSLLPDGEATEIQIMAQQFNWNARYPGADGVFGSQQMTLIADSNTFGVDPEDPNGDDDIQIPPLTDIHVPINKPVVTYISSKDVIHSFKVIAFRVTQDAIPGMRIPTWFKPTQLGRYQITCAQLCGNAHSAMANGFIVVEEQEDYDAWLVANSGEPTSFE